MGRRAKSKKNGKAEPVGPKPPKNEHSRFRDLEKRLEESLAREKATGALLQEQTRALTDAHAQITEALEQKAATSEILRVIASSPTDVQPVFDTIVTNAARLCEASSTAVCLARDGFLHLDALHLVWMTEGLEGFQRQFPVPITSDVARTLRGQTFHIADIAHNPAATEGMKTLARHGGYESMVWVPLMRGDEGLGLLSVVRATPRPFDENQIAVLRSFAHQAVIAIENVRLFKELQERNRQVTDALEQQTATSEILRVISQSPTDTQPVFDAIVQSARGLLDAHSAAVFRTVGQDIHLGAYTSTGPGGDEDITSFFPKPLAWLAREGPDFARPWVDGGIEHVADLGVGSDEQSAWRGHAAIEAA